MEDLSFDNKLCSMCYMIIELLKYKQELLADTLYTYKNITLYEYMKESNVLDQMFFKRIATYSVSEWKETLKKMWCTKVDTFIKNDKRKSPIR